MLDQKELIRLVLIEGAVFAAAVGLFLMNIITLPIMMVILAMGTPPLLIFILKNAKKK